MLLLSASKIKPNFILKISISNHVYKLIYIVDWLSTISYNIKIDINQSNDVIKILMIAQLCRPNQRQNNPVKIELVKGSINTKLNIQNTLFNNKTSNNDLFN
jgi:hypothetical protein